MKPVPAMRQQKGRKRTERGEGCAWWGSSCSAGAALAPERQQNKTQGALVVVHAGHVPHSPEAFRDFLLSFLGGHSRAHKVRLAKVWVPFAWALEFLLAYLTTQCSPIRVQNWPFLSRSDNRESAGASRAEIFDVLCTVPSIRSTASGIG